MMFKVRYFAYFKEKVGADTGFVELEGPHSVGNLRKKVADLYQIDDEKILVAVNGSFSDLKRVLNPDDEIAIFPPVSGGDAIKVTEENFDVEKVLSSIKTDEVGCVVNFIGVVRAVSDYGTIQRMDIEVYPEMAEKQLQIIKEEAMKRFGVKEIVIIHRFGSLHLGDNIILIAVSSGHREEAFPACQYVIDEIKKRVPIWKKEYTSAGEKWVEVV